MKKRVARKEITRKPRRNFSTLQWIILGLIIIAAIFLIYKATTTGNVITGNPVADEMLGPSSSDTASASPSEALTELKGKMLGKINDIFTNIFKGDEKYDYFTNILSPEILLGILVFLIIFAIIDHISIFRGKKWLSVGLSIVVSILAAGFIDPTWIKPIFNQYQALGILISFALPFVFIFYFLKEVAPYNQLVHRLIWGAFSIIVIINLIINWKSIDLVISKWLYVILIIMSLIMLFWGKRIFKAIFKEELHQAIDSYQQILDLITAKQKADAQNALNTQGAQLSPTQQTRLRDIINKMP